MTFVGRRTRVPLWLVLILAVGSLGAGAPAAGGSSSDVRADLEGKPIAIEDIHRYSCHDLEFPVIRCFKSQAATERAIERASIAESGFAAMGTLGVTYVVAYDQAWFAPGTLYVSQVYDNLGAIGWNDIISSYRSVNNGSGHFAKDAFDNGLLTYFCCNVQVGWVGSSQNDSYSSIYPY